MCFLKEFNQDALKEQHGKLDVCKAMKFKLEAWENLTEEEKKSYEENSAQDKLRYEKEVDQLRTYGYFIDQTGKKSTDLKKKKSK